MRCVESPAQKEYVSPLHWPTRTSRWSAVTPQLIREQVGRLAITLRDADIPLIVYPCAEVTAHPQMEASWRQGALLSVADRGAYLLVEMPNGLFIDLRKIIRGLQHLGVCTILAHAERQPELLHDVGLIEQFIESGCLVQVNSSSVTEPSNDEDASALEDWFKRGIVHLMGSDGHSPRRRRPQMAEAYRQIVRWAGVHMADRVCSINGTAILHGLPLRVPPPQPRRTKWFARLW